MFASPHCVLLDCKSLSAMQARAAYFFTFEETPKYTWV